MNPYGIQQVDVPGLLSVYQGAQQSRTQQMLAKKQVELQERQEDRKSRFASALEKGMGGGKPSPVAAYEGGSQVPGFGQPPDTQPATDQAAPMQGAAPTAQPRPTNFQLSPETMAQLIALDADEASNVIQAFSQMNEAQHKASQQVNETLGRAAQFLLSVPEQDRAAEIQRIAPILARQGIDEGAISQFAPTQRNLEFLIAQSRDVEKLREEAMPKLRNVQAGDMIIDERRIGQPGSPTVYESPYIKGPDGAIYEKTGGGQTPEQLRAAADEAIRQGADPAAVNARLQQMLGGGGGGNATGNFPGG